MTAIKHDQGKPPLGLIPYTPSLMKAQVLGFGEGKYGRHNWREGMEWSRFIDAALRHIQAWNEGEDLDPETGLSHLAHAACCLDFLMEYQAKGLGTDDRFTPESEKIIPVPEERTRHLGFPDGTRFEMRNDVLHAIHPNGFVEVATTS